jgi:hypothetical protein
MTPIAARRRNKTVFWAFAACSVLAIVDGRAWAWGPEGHQTVAVIADKLIEGTPAGDQARTILGNVTLEEAAIWADCVKGVDLRTFRFLINNVYPQCATFETPEGEADLVDFAERNETNCRPKVGEEICHKQYHYCDVSIRNDHYDRSLHGARNDDITAAVAAAVEVLRDQSAPEPFSIKDKREALLLLVHFVGDIHEPLHVGSVYLDAEGSRVNPDGELFDPSTDTHGSNSIMIGNSNLHATWDAVPESLGPSKVTAAWLNEAKAVPMTLGPMATWPVAWANETLKEARKALAGVSFGPLSHAKWTASLPSEYAESMSATKRAELTKAGARLAQTLQAIWPADRAVASGNTWVLLFIGIGGAVGTLSVVFALRRNRRSNAPGSTPTTRPEAAAQAPADARPASTTLRVFISHASADRHEVEQEVIALLRRHGLDPWYARTEILTASEWQREILSGLKKSDWFLVVLTPRATASKWVKSEVDWAFQHRQGRVIPVMLEDCSLEDLHLHLRLIQHVDLRSPSDEERARLLATWGLLLKPAKSDDTSPASG